MAKKQNQIKAAKAPKEKLPKGFWQKKIYIPGIGMASGEATTAQMNAFLKKAPMSSLKTRLSGEDPLAKIMEEREIKRKKRLGLK